METDNREKNNWRPQQPLRWYEWLVVLLLLVLANGVRAQPVYKCTDAGGAVAYQDRPCIAGSRESAIEIAAAPVYAPSPQYAIDRAAPVRASKARKPRRESEPQSFECRSSDGQVFFRHGGCPHSVAAVAGASAPSSRRGSPKAAPASVSAQRISREEACRKIHTAGSIGRAGHEHDEDVSTYERNLGHDPCR